MVDLRVSGAAALTLLAALAILVQPQPASAQRVSDWDAPIAEASARFGIPAEWIRRVIQAESGGRTTLNGRPIRSRAGAMGLMQLMPGTWRAMRRKHDLGLDPDDPRDNILAGTAYLRAMYDRFGYPGLFAAYNAGPGRYGEYLARGRRLPAETVAYVARVSGRTPSYVSDLPRDEVRHPAGNMPMPKRSSEGRLIASDGAGNRAISTLFFPLGEARH